MADWKLFSWLRPAAATTTDAPLTARIEALYSAIEGRLIDLPCIRPEQLLEALAAPEPPTLLDVRTESERQVSVIPGAVFEVAAVSAGARVVAYCTLGLRSGKAARELRQRGIDVLNLRGGILAWVAAGGALADTRGQPTRRLHVYGQRWDVVPADVEAVY